MRTLIWREAEVHPGVELNQGEAAWLSAENIAQIRPTRVDGVFEVIVGNVCGVISMDNLQITIQPKLPIASLLWMMLYSRGEEKWQPEAATLGSSDMVEGLAEVFASVLGRALQSGMLHGYHSVEETGFTLRGRLRLKDQMSRHFGALLPLEMEVDDFNQNIPENQILGSALEALIQVLILDPRYSPITQRLHQLRQQFAEVELLSPGGLLPQWKKNRLNEHLWVALALAEIILKDSGLEVSGGHNSARGIIIRMPSLFEQFLAEAFRREAPELTTHSQFSTPLATNASAHIRPDLVLMDGPEKIAVIDAKYKRGNPQPQDLYQALTYATVLQLNEAILIYPEALTVDQQELNIHGSPISVRLVGLDLSKSPDEILGTIRSLIDTIKAQLPCFT